MDNYVIITGASQGIGKSTAAFFLQQQWRVINLSRHNCDLPHVLNVNIDLSDIPAFQQQREQLSNLLPGQARICLIHNAANYYKDTIYDIDAEKFNYMLAVNVVAPMLLNQIVLSKMTANSSIIYLGSTLSEKAVPGAASYTITKHAVVGMMGATCQDLNRPDIHTCSICPGFVETEMMRSHLKNNPELMSTIKNKVAAKRIIQPEEIASLIYYCANNPVVNGSIIHANLGQIES